MPVSKKRKKRSNQYRPQASRRREDSYGFAAPPWEAIIGQYEAGGSHDEIAVLAQIPFRIQGKPANMRTLATLAAPTFSGASQYGDTLIDNAYDIRELANAGYLVWDQSRMDVRLSTAGMSI